MTEKYLGIVVSGGPAPGINSVIASVVIRAYHHGIQVKAFNDGFQGIVEGGPNSVKLVAVDDVTPYADRGGSVVRTSRYNPFSDDHRAAAFRAALEAHRIGMLVVIGGEGSAFLSYQVHRRFPEIQTAHVPKTIDNDITLPNNYPSFGFETARDVATRLVKSIAADARTTNRWYVVTTMGRKSGALALGAGVASGATLTIIPEEFEGTVPLSQVSTIILESIKRRVAQGKRFGVVVLAEGVVEKLDPASNEELAKCPRDDLGRLHYSELDLERIVVRDLKRRCLEQGITVHLAAANIGYELRAHDPVSFDLEYTRFLGLGAVDLLTKQERGFMVARDYDRLVPIPLESMIDCNGRMRSRSVDVRSDNYLMARSLMIR